jgi:hypothetical protein
MKFIIIIIIICPHIHGKHTIKTKKLIQISLARPKMKYLLVKKKLCSMDGKFKKKTSKKR